MLFGAVEWIWIPPSSVMAQKKVPACFWFIDVCFDICAGAVLPPIGKRTKKPSQQTLRAVWQCSATPKASPMNVSSTYFCVLMFLRYLYWYICSVFWGSVYASGAHKWHSPCRPMFWTLEYVQSRYGWREIIIMIISKVHILKRPWALCRELDGRWRSGLHYKIKRNEYKNCNS